MRTALLLALAVSRPLTITIGEIPLEPGTWWEFRESYTEHLGGLDSISDDITRFEVRGTLYAGRNTEPFVIRKGEAFQMIAAGGESGCRIRFDKREHDLSSCPWLEGFTDHWTDIFEVGAQKK